MPGESHMHSRSVISRALTWDTLSASGAAEAAAEAVVAAAAASATAAGASNGDGDGSLLSQEEASANVRIKLLALVVVVAISLLGSFLPLRLTSLSDSLRHTVTEQCRFFTAGVFLGVGLLHMLPEAVEGFEDLLSASGPNALFPSATPPLLSNLTGLGGVATGPTGPLPVAGSAGGTPWGNFPVAYAICCLGFVLVWFVEKRIVSGPEGALLAAAADAPGLLPQGGGMMGAPGGGAPRLGPDLDQRRMVAMAAGAESQGGASLCVVHVASVASYGPHSCQPPAHHSPPIPSEPLSPQGKPSPAHPQPQYPPSPDRACPMCSAVGAAGGPGHAEGDGFSSRGAVLRKGRKGSGGGAGASGEDPQEEVSAHRGRYAHRHQHQHRDAERVALLEGTEEGWQGRHSQGGEGRAEPGAGAGAGAGAGLEGEGGEGACEECGSSHPGQHQWKSGAWSGIRGGSPDDACAGLHQHTHTAQHHHIVLHGRGAVSLLLAALFSLHSLVVGAALGTETHLAGAVSLIIAVIAHKGAEAFAVGVQFVKEGVPVAKMVVVMLLYCAMTPLGILLGMTACLLGGPAGTLITTTTQAFGAGTVLYIVMMELSDGGAASSAVGATLQLLLLLAGLGLMAAVSVFV